MGIKHFFIFCNLLMTYVNIYSQSPNETFSDITTQSGITFKYTFGDYSYENILESSGSGLTILDYNNDGFMDVYMLNGTYLDGISDDDGIVFQNTPNELYRNNGDGPVYKLLPR